MPDWHVHGLDGVAALSFEQQLDALLAIIEALPLPRFCVGACPLNLYVP